MAKLHFWNIDKIISIPVKQPKLFQVLLSFSWSTRARGLFRSARVCEEVLKFCPLADKRGSLEGVRERGFNDKNIFVVKIFSENRNTSMTSMGLYTLLGLVRMRSLYI